MSLLFQKNYYLITWAIMAFGLCLLLYAIIPLGIGLSEDSISYLAAAYSLYHSGQMLDIDGTPFVAWTPLYPLVISMLELLPFNIIESSLLGLHALIYLCLAFTTRLLIQQSMERVFFRIVCFAAIFLSFTMLQTSATALSEALFLLLVNMVMLAAGSNRTLTTKDIAMLALFAALAMLQRYAGVFLMLFFVLFFLLGRNRDSNTFRHQWLMLLLAFTPLGLWLFRNWLAADTLTGFRSYNPERFWLNIHSMLETFTSWVFPMAIPLILRLLLFAPLLWVIWTGVKAQNIIHIVLLVGYLLMLTGCYLVFSFEEPRDRLLSPVFISLFILIFSGLERLAEKYNTKVFVISALIAAWLIYPLARTLKHVQHWHNWGVETYNHPSWKQSQMAIWLKKNTVSGKIFSNDAAAVYHFTRKGAFRVPKRIYSSDEFNRMVENGDLLIWWNNRNLYDLKSVENILTLTEIARVDDGAVYTIHR